MSYRSELRSLYQGDRLPNPESIALAATMREGAAEAVAYAKQTYAIDLDYSEESLADVDRIIEDRTRGGVLNEESLTPQEREGLWLYSLMIGAYVGEVIVRNLGGIWVAKKNEDGSTSVKLMAAGTIEGAPPDSVWRTMTEPYRSMTTYYRTLQAALDRGEERLEIGVQVVKLPPLSSKPPDSRRRQRPWWKLW